MRHTGVKVSKCERGQRKSCTARKTAKHASRKKKQLKQKRRAVSEKNKKSDEGALTRGPVFQAGSFQASVHLPAMSSKKRKEREKTASMC
jgi:hypothetical protein